MPKTITVTPNTAIDCVISLTEFALGDTVVASASVEFAAGKGVNVAKALEALAQPVIAVGFVGQSSLGVFSALNSPLLTTNFIPVCGKTRSNITLSTVPLKQETHVRTTGYSVTAENCQQLLETLTAQTQAGDIVVLSGSLPLGAPPDLYKSLIAACQAQSVVVFLDSSGDALKMALSAKPYLIKPNQQELEALVGRCLPDERAIISAAQAIVAQGIQCVVVSRGEQGALVVTDKHVVAAAVANDRGAVISSIGCGDAMLAGFACARLQQLDLNAAIKLGVACGTANLFTVEPGRFDTLLMESIRQQVTLQSL